MRPGKRIILYAVVVSLSASALLAIGILLFGRLGETEGRILGTTALIAGYGLLALPAGMLLDQARLKALAAVSLALACLGLSLALVSIWTNGSSAVLGKSVATVTVFAVASTQTAALSVRRHEGDPTSTRRLFSLSVVLALALATMATVAAWGDIGRQGYFRVIAALAVLDLLVVVLQPILALTRPARFVYGLAVVTQPGGSLELTVEAEDFAAAASQTIRRLEADGRHVRRLELVAGPPYPTTAPPVESQPLRVNGG